MIFIKGEFVEVIQGPWKGYFGQIAKVFNLDKDEYPYMIYIVHDNETRKIQVKGTDLLVRKFREKEIEFSTYLKYVKK